MEKIRVTVVMEYPDKSSVPLIGMNTKTFNEFKFVRVAYFDAMAELEIRNRVDEEVSQLLRKAIEQLRREA